MRKALAATPPSVRAAQVALVSGAAITFLTIGAAALYALPNADEFCRARLQPVVIWKDWQGSATAFEYVVDSWHFWTGRWASMWIEAAALSNMNVLGFYPAALLSVWLVILASLWLLVRQVLPGINGIFATALLFATFWLAAPEPGNALFWFTGAVENLLPVALGAAAIALLTLRRVWPATLLSFVVPGLHELFGAILVVVLVTGALLAVGNRLPWLICATLALVSEALVVGAPGNAIRALSITGHEHGSLLGVTVWQLTQTLPDWSLTGAVIALTIAIIAVRPEAPWTEHFRGWRLLIIPIATLALTVVAIGGASYLQKAALSGRTLSGIFLAFLLGWLLTAIAAAQRLRWDNVQLGSLCGFALATALVMQGNTRAVLFDLKDRVGPWHAGLKARYAILRSAHQDLVLVPPAPATPNILMWTDITEDPTDFRNVCVARYFRVSGVAIRGR